MRITKILISTVHRFQSNGYYSLNFYFLFLTRSLQSFHSIDLKLNFSFSLPSLVTTTTIAHHHHRRPTPPPQRRPSEVVATGHGGAAETKRSGGTERRYRARRCREWRRRDGRSLARSHLHQQQHHHHRRARHHHYGCERRPWRDSGWRPWWWKKKGKLRRLESFF